MQELQLYIEGQRIDLFKDETVSLTQTIQNVKDPAKIFTSFTKTFSVPASKTNNKIFKHYYNYDIVNGYDARIKKAGNIELNHIAYKTGRIKLEGVSLKNNLAHTYRITFFGNTVELPDILGDDKLGSLPFSSSDYNLEYREGVIKAYLSSVINTGKLIVPLITHTQRLIYNSVTTGNPDNVYYSGAQQGVKFDELKFAVRLYEIILEIESKYTIANGYAANILFSRDFFSTSNPTFYNLYMWLHRKSGDVQPAQQIASFTTISPSWTGTITPIIRSGNTIIIISDLVTAPSQIFDNILTVTPSAGNQTDFQIGVNLNGTRILTTTPSNGTTQINNLNGIPLVANGVYSVSIIHPIAMTISSITWNFQGVQRFTDGSAPSGYNVTASISQFACAATFDFVTAEQIPDVGIMSFLTGLFKMFNLVAYVDDNATIVVRPLDGSQGVSNSFYTAADINGNDAPVNYNISKFVDVTASEVNIALPYKEVLYKYEGTGSFFAKQHNQLFGSNWGALGYIGGTETDGSGGLNFNASTEIYNLTVPFEHMKFERLLNGNGGAETDIQWGWSVNENQQSYIGKPLIFYAIRKTNGTNLSFQRSANQVTFTNAYWIPSNSLNLQSTSSPGVNINFGQELNEYEPSEVFANTLFADFHSQYIIDVFNTSRRITKVTAFLPLKILYNFKLNDTFTINSRNYIVNSITTNLQNGKSQLELLNKVSLFYGTIAVVFQGSAGFLFYRSSIGSPVNLAFGDVMFTNKELTNFPTAGTYVQQGSNTPDTHCQGSGFIMAMVINSTGVITSITCGQP